MPRLAACLTIGLLLAGCSRQDPAEAPAGPPPIAARTAIAAPAGTLAVAVVPASVVQPPGARVAVATPFAGLVRSVHVQPGQSVAKGQLLATLVSRDAMMLAAELAQAETRRGLAASEAARAEELARAGVIAASRADSAVAARRQAEIASRSTRAILAQTGAGPDGQVRLVAPIAGRVASIGMEAGAAVDGMSAPIVIEAEGSRWLALQIPERLAGVVRPGLAVQTEDGRTGRLETVAATLDPATRALPARARLTGDGPPLTSGRLLRLTIIAPAPAGAVRVPLAGLVTENQQDMVFVKGREGFAPRQVVRAGTGDPAVITEGLKAGEAVAISNLPELRAAAQR